MIELPRAALTALRIAEAAEFFSFGTNDLTQTTWGFSRDDVEAAIFATYLDKGVFTVSPFESPRPRRRRAARADRRRGRARAPAPTSSSASAASTAATPTRSTSSTASGSTTSPAPRSGCRWPGWRPGGRRSRPTRPRSGRMHTDALKQQYGSEVRTGAVDEWGPPADGPPGVTARLRRGTRSPPAARRDWSHPRRVVTAVDDVLTCDLPPLRLDRRGA